MNDGKINISWDELKTRRVENRLREQQAVARNRAYSQLNEDALPEATPIKTSLWHNTVFVTTAFGLLGGFLAWMAHLGFAAMLPAFAPRVLHYDPGASSKAQVRLAEIHNIEAARDVGRYTPTQAAVAIQQVQFEARDNPYLALALDTRLTDSQHQQRLAALKDQDDHHKFIIQVISYGMYGLLIALCLAVSEPLSQRKTREAWIDGTLGALLGIAGGVVAALVSTTVADWAGSTVAGKPEWVKGLAMFTAIFGTLGLFLGIASGLVVWNLKRLLIGMAGGLAGGLVGGALYVPILRGTASETDALLLALLAIGGLAALGTGFIENAAKAGWLKVTTGIIAGKQFILYRNPTYIGSAPDCQIYLFKDPKVGKRHAAIHITPVGIEIEDLPLGAETLVNGKPITRSPLRNNDRIAVGSTLFVFQERRPTAGK